MSYEKQQECLRKWMDTVSDNDSDNDAEIFENDGSDDEWLPRQNNNEDSDVEDVYADQDVSIEVAEDDESDDDDCDASLETFDKDVLHGKDGTIWKCAPPIARQTENHNILRQKPGPVSSTKGLSIQDTFKRIFTDRFCNIIVNETNRKAERVYTKWNSENPKKKSKVWKDLTSEEFDAFLGILITAGVRHSNTEHITELWKSDSYPLYRATMSYNRFKLIIRFIRFDNERTRLERGMIDKAAPISELWLMLNENLKSLYIPSECVTVDEQLFPYRGRTKFTQYIPSKPAKYGIKIWWVCDSRSSYPLSGQIYTGKPVTGRDTNQGERVVKDLCYQYKNTGINIATDNFFTTLPLAKLLMNWGLSIVGTLKKNKPYIPPEMLANKSREPMSSLFGFSEDKVTICSYVPKKMKSVIMLSTMHYTNDVSGSKHKPEIIHYYNSVKGGVDNMDKMLTHYTTKRRTNRWPLAMFFNMIDIACLASYIIYSENNPDNSKRTDSRRIFLKDLGRSLAMPAIVGRSTNRRVSQHFGTRSGIECMLGRPLTFAPVSAGTNKPTGFTGTCYICRTNKTYRKTRKACCTCNQPICLEHSNSVVKCSSCTV